MPGLIQPVAAGLLRHRVTHQTMTTTTDAYGQDVQSWVDQSTYWAYVRPLSGRELDNAQKLRADISHLVTLRHLGSTTILPTDRLIYKSRILAIGAVLNVDERNHTLSIFCTESGILPSTDTFTVYWGDSASTVLDETGILGLTSGLYSTTSWRTTYVFPQATAQYKYICLPASFSPVATILDPNTGFQVAMDLSAPYTSVANGINFLPITVNSVACRLYRSLNKMGGIVPMALT